MEEHLSLDQYASTEDSSAVSKKITNGWGPDLRIEILRLFAELQGLVDQQSGVISRWNWFRDKRREIDRKASQKPSRKAYKRSKAHDSAMIEIRRRLEAGERPKKWGKRWLAVATDMGLVIDLPARASYWKSRRQ